MEGEVPLSSPSILVTLWLSEKGRHGMPEQTHKKTYKLGVISDTHGLLRSAVIKTLEDCDYIVHAGDVDKPSVCLLYTSILTITDM